MENRIAICKSISFYDPYGRTRLSGHKALLFCAYNGFTIPHDTVGAILYNEILRGAGQVVFDNDILKLFTPSMTTYAEDADWLLKAIESMGYKDIVDEFRCLNDKFKATMREKISSGPYSVSSVIKTLEEVIPARYLPPKK